MRTVEDEANHAKSQAQNYDSSLKELQSAQEYTIKDLRNKIETLQSRNNVLESYETNLRQSSQKINDLQVFLISNMTVTVCLVLFFLCVDFKKKTDQKKPIA